MGIKFRCQACDRKLHVKSFLAGKRGVCPRCGARSVFPPKTGRSRGTVPAKRLAPHTSRPRGARSAGCRGPCGPSDGPPTLRHRPRGESAPAGRPGRRSHRAKWTRSRKSPARSGMSDPRPGGSMGRRTPPLCGGGWMKDASAPTRWSGERVGPIGNRRDPSSPRWPPWIHRPLIHRAPPRRARGRRGVSVWSPDSGRRAVTWPGSTCLPPAARGGRHHAGRHLRGAAGGALLGCFAVTADRRRTCPIGGVLVKYGRGTNSLTTKRLGRIDERGKEAVGGHCDGQRQ